MHKGKFGFEITTTNNLFVCLFFYIQIGLKLYKWSVPTYKMEGALRGVSAAIITVLRAKMDRMNSHDIHVPLSWAIVQILLPCDLLCCYSALSEDISAQDKKVYFNMRSVNSSRPELFC